MSTSISSFVCVAVLYTASTVSKMTGVVGVDYGKINTTTVHGWAKKTLSHEESKTLAHEAIHNGKALALLDLHLKLPADWIN